MSAIRQRKIAEAFRAARAAGATEGDALERAVAAAAEIDRRLRWAAGADLPQARIDALLALVAGEFGAPIGRLTARHWLTREMAGARWIAARLLVDAGMSRKRVAPLLGFAGHDGVCRGLAQLARRPDLLARLEALRARPAALATPNQEAA